MLSIFFYIGQSHPKNSPKQILLIILCSEKIHWNSCWLGKIVNKTAEDMIFFIE